MESGFSLMPIRHQRFVISLYNIDTDGILKMARAPMNTNVPAIRSDPQLSLTAAA